MASDLLITMATLESNYERELLQPVAHLLGGVHRSSDRP